MRGKLTNRRLQRRRDKVDEGKNCGYGRRDSFLPQFDARKDEKRNDSRTIRALALSLRRVRDRYLYMINVCLTISIIAVLAWKMSIDPTESNGQRQLQFSSSVGLSFASPEPVQRPVPLQNVGVSKVKDYGSLKLGSGAWLTDDTEEEKRDCTDDTSDNYYAFDDDEKRNPYSIYQEWEENKKFRRTTWHRRLPIACNSFHEVDFLEPVRNGELRFIDAGGYRQVYLFKLEQTSFILKTTFLSAAYDFRDFEFMRMDAIVSDIFSANELVVDVFGFCALGMTSKAMLNGNLESIVLTRTTDTDKPAAGSEKGVDADPHNTFSGLEKYSIVLQMAEALNQLHMYTGGVIVHDDVHPGQFLLKSNGRLKLHDFNRAEIMWWDEEDSIYC